VLIRPNRPIKSVCAGAARSPTALRRPATSDSFDDQPRASLNLSQKKLSCGKEGDGIGFCMAALERMCDQVDIQPARSAAWQECDSLIVRGHAAADPAVDEPSRIEERTQVRLVVLRVEHITRGEASRIFRPVVKGRPTKIASDFIQRGPGWLHMLVLYEHHRVIEIVEPVQERKRPTTKWRSVQKSESEGARRGDISFAAMRISSIAVETSPAAVVSAMSMSLYRGLYPPCARLPMR